MIQRVLAQQENDNDIQIVKEAPSTLLKTTVESKIEINGQQ
jgi:hypothetical protein